MERAWAKPARTRSAEPLELGDVVHPLGEARPKPFKRLCVRRTTIRQQVWLHREVVVLELKAFHRAAESSPQLLGQSLELSAHLLDPEGMRVTANRREGVRVRLRVGLEAREEEEWSTCSATSGGKGLATRTRRPASSARATAAPPRPSPNHAPAGASASPRAVARRGCEESHSSARAVCRRASSEESRLASSCERHASVRAASSRPAAEAAVRSALVEALAL